MRMEQQSAPDTERKNTSWISVVVILLILAGVVLTGYYSVRVLGAFRDIRHTALQPGVTDPGLVRSWMTIPYIARSYRIPEKILWQGVGISEQGNRLKSIRMLNRDYSNDKPGIILSKVIEIITQYEKRNSSGPTANLFNSSARGLVPAS